MVAFGEILSGFASIPVPSYCQVRLPYTFTSGGSQDGARGNEVITF